MAQLFTRRPYVYRATAWASVQTFILPHKVDKICMDQCSFRLQSCYRGQLFSDCWPSEHPQMALLCYCSGLECPLGNIAQEKIFLRISLFFHAYQRVSHPSLAFSRGVIIGPKLLPSLHLAVDRECLRYITLINLQTGQIKTLVYVVTLLSWPAVQDLSILGC